MDRFLTECETERLLEQESRLVALPDGGRHVMTLFRLVWNSADLIERTGIFRKDELIALASQHASRTGEPLEASFERVVGHAHRRLCGD